MQNKKDKKDSAIICTLWYNKIRKTNPKKEESEKQNGKIKRINTK